jgi:uncharacterized membrane-anchored protein YitT (DUF2179 family)
MKRTLRGIKPIQIRAYAEDVFLLALGAFILAANINLFLKPADIAPGGVSGIGIILNHVAGWPIGLVMFLLNIPLIGLGFRFLGRFQFLFRTLIVVVLYSLGTDLMANWLPEEGLTDELLLNALYGGILGGLGSGLIFRGRGTTAGTGVLSRIFQLRTGLPVSHLYLLTDGGVVLLAVFVFGWERALYALITLFVWGLTTDFILEGPSVIRTAIIITDHPEEVSNAVMDTLHLGLTSWIGKGMFTGSEHSVLFCTLRRPDVRALRSVVTNVDPEAFLVIGQGHQSSGGVLQDPRAQKVATKLEHEEEEVGEAEESP